MKRKKYFLKIGSVSEGTMRTEDLIWTFADELTSLRLTRSQRSRLNGIVTRASHDQDGSYFDSEEASWDMEALMNTLNDHCPDYTYFWAHPGDGADYCCWIFDNIEYDFDELKVNDLSEVPIGFTGHVLHVNDHGNMTLYAASRGRLRELWAVI